jgi:type I restriction enzyme, S subunit
MNASSLVPLGEVLVPDRDEVEVEPDQSYCMAGIYSFGRGLFQRGHILGAETSYKLLFRLHRDQFVVSRLNGWEGAVDVVPEDLDGCLVSNEFPTFSIRPDRAHPSYLRWVARWPSFWENLVPRGSMVRRKRVQPSQLLEVEIPLPPVPDQERIVERLDSSNEKLTRIARAQHEAAGLGEAMVEAAVWEVFRQGLAAGWPTASLGTVAEVGPPRDQVPPDERIGWVPMAALDDKSGTISPGEREAGEARSGYKQFRKGDILFARITPSMQNGKCAVFTGPHSHGYGSTEFHVIRPQNGTQARWIHRFLRTKEIRMQAAKHFTGTAGQQRVPADFLRRLEIPVPPKTDQIEALEKIDRIVETGATLRNRRAKSRELRAALEPAVLNQVLSIVS